MGCQHERSEMDDALNCTACLTADLKEALALLRRWYASDGIAPVALELDTDACLKRHDAKEGT